MLAAALIITRPGGPPEVARVNVASGRPTVTPRAAGRHEAALAYIRGHDWRGATHVRRLVWSGPMLRLYTDLPGSAVNSRTAVTLCRTAAAYLLRFGHGAGVFVHARGHDGYPVLANKLSARDGCHLNGVP